MDSNRDESERCIDIAVEALNASNYEKAEKFLRKAQILYPSQKATDLLHHLKKIYNPKNGVHQRRKPQEEKNNTPPDQENSQTYTKEQLDLVKKINKAKDYYEMLNITKEATDSEIKKAYKKIALLLHPDKNSAPGSSEAFKLVGTAVATLTDPKKRKEYDFVSKNPYITNRRENNFSNGSGFSGFHHHFHSNYENDRFESEVSPEELFNMFFGEFPSQERRRFNSSNHQHHETGPQPSLAFGLILVLILISMLSSFFTSDPLYRLSYSNNYNVQRHTVHLGIPYYVKQSFADDYQGSVARLESSVEEDYINTMKQNCFREKNYREAMISRARTFGSRSQIAQAQALKIPSCENLAKIGLTRYAMF
ncbi:dnaJ homolog subfamily B member 14-like [Condylostylus longicornis]|uniref:dnaJ homolog subfamily B member 14-like n=1 Tax=Condylostylus longicornis TaxID=2530218 RepID=UPI00244E591E|nr:dnaJ homolog subfamily B member 14-like [Condylostylus longicornis]